MANWHLHNEHRDLSTEDINDVTNYVKHLTVTYPNMSQKTLEIWLKEYCEMINIKLKETA